MSFSHLTNSFNFLFLLLLEWPILLLIVLISSFYIFRLKSNSSKHMENFFSNFFIGGHRGSPINQPENTMASMKQAKEEGVDLVEFDISLTKDGIPIIFHDDTLDRTTNLSGKINDYTFEKLSNCNCAAKFFFKQPRSKDEVPLFMAIPKLDDMVNWSKENHIKMLIDVKDFDTKLIITLVELFEKHQLYDIAIISSFFPQIPYQIKRYNSKILTGLTWRRWFFTYSDLYGQIRRHPFILKHYLAILFDIFYLWCVQTWLPSFLGVDMILTERAEISESFVRRQEKANRKVCAWTVNDENEMIWMNKCLSIPFLTDKPFLAKQIGLVKKN